MQNGRTQYSFNEAEREVLFGLLDRSLSYGRLRTKTGARMVLPQEFELKHKTRNGIVGFEHVFSGNFIFLLTKVVTLGNVLLEPGTIYIPMEDRAHMRGYFDGPTRDPELADGK